MLNKPKIQRFLTAPEAAKEIGISTPTVLKLLRDRKIPHFRFGRCVRINAEDFEKFKSDHKIDQIVSEK